MLWAGRLYTERALCHFIGALIIWLSRNPKIDNLLLDPAAPPSTAQQRATHGGHVVIHTPLRRNTLNPPPNPIQIPTPSTHHAFLIAPVIAHDPGKGDLIDLALPDGTILRAKAGVDVLRLGSNINGPWRATLHFDTTEQAKIKEPIQVPKLVSLSPDLETAQPTWGAAGKVVRLDRVEGLVVIRVYPKTGLILPFVIAAIASLEQLSSVEHATGLRLRGTLRDRHLIATHLEPLDLHVPTHWKSWQPPIDTSDLEVIGRDRDSNHRP
jgi:hypothetical protein